MQHIIPNMRHGGLRNGHVPKYDALADANGIGERTAARMGLSRPYLRSAAWAAARRAIGTR